MRLIHLGLLFCISSAAFGKSPTQPPVPNNEPAWDVVRRESESFIQGELVDPDSAKIKWTKGFAWSYYKPTMRPRVFGWVSCGLVNAKNKMGGYTGDTPFVIVYDNGVKLMEIDEYIGPWCSGPHFPAPQKAFLESPSVIGLNSVADELTKLAALKDRGVISPEEFTAEKAKLLAIPASVLPSTPK